MKSKSLFRRHLALTTILAVTPFFGYGRQAHAACDPTAPGSSTIICSGTNTATVTIVNVDSANVSTAPGFSVDAAGDGVHINGFGHIRFTDTNAATIKGGTGAGIVAYSQGGAGADPAAITISTDGNITGGDNGIKAMNYGGGAIAITANGAVEATSGAGIYAYNAGNDGVLTIRTGGDSVVTGSRDGIDARNFGAGDTEITVNGMVTGASGAGITTFNLPEGGNIVINIGADSEVEGGQRGINAQNFGMDSDLVIGIDGKVSGEDAVVAANSVFSRNLTITQGAGSVIAGEESGIVATNFGSGDLVITADGEVEGGTETGIHARNGEAGGGIEITTGAASKVTGLKYGIDAENLGDGDLTIIAKGEVKGTGTWDYYSATGIRAYNGAGGGSLSITTGAGSVIEGIGIGIEAKNHGEGDLFIGVASRVSASYGTAIYARNYETGGDFTIATAIGSTIVASDMGSAIEADNFGRGSLDITVNGDVTSVNYHGIRATNFGKDLKITVGAQSTVSGSFFGIDAWNEGQGDLGITVLGEVNSPNNAVVAANRGADLNILTGTGSVINGSYRGIMAKNYSGGDLTIIAYGEVTGSESRGIYVSSYWSASTYVKVGATGLVQGGASGIYVSATEGREVVITNNGEVRNISGASNDLAVEVEDGAARLTNNGKLIGRITLGDYDDVVDNAGTWTVGSGAEEDESATFGAGEDTLNNRGMLIAASDAERGETTTINALETFNNSGVIKLSDGAADDVLEIAGNVRFNGMGGRLVVDAELNEGGKADRLIINGTFAGVTAVSVKATGAIGANSDGIAVIEVNGSSGDGDVTLDAGSRNMGFFAWDMRRNAEDGDLFELYSTGLGAGAHEFAGGITAAQDVWFQSTGTLLQRQADLRAAITGTQVTPVADFTDPVAPIAAGRAMPGFWFKALGAYLERDAEENGITLDRRQTVFGGLAGLDMGMDLEGPGETMLFGLFGGYLTSDLKFKTTNSKWDYEGPSIGAYASYLNQAFYADVTVKADFLSIDIDADDLAPGTGEADTKGFNIGGQIDAGYRIGLDHGLFVEPQASLAVLHTEIDDVDDILGGAVEFDDETSVRGRLGARLGHEFTDGNALIYSSDITASVWQEFNGSNGATILAPDFAVAGVSDDTVGTFGDVSVGFSVTSPDGWSSFLRGSWQFAEDFDALSAHAGLRYAW